MEGFLKEGESPIEVYTSVKSKTCTECLGERKVCHHPLIYVDLFGGEYPDGEYTSMGLYNTKKLPDIKLHLSIDIQMTFHVGVVNDK